MGVIYKLNDKVKEFIINQKKENTHFSCRGLVAIIKKKFRITLSKSAINSVIKQAQLSSPVGRKASKKVSQISEGPTEKPVKILTVKPAELPEIKPKEKTELLVPAEEKIPEKKPQPQLPITAPVTAQPVEIPEVKKEEPVSERVETPQPVEIKEDEIIDNLGLFFLKATEWLFSSSSIIAEAAKMYLTAYSAQDLEANSQALLYLAALGIEEPSAIKSYDNKDIWVINQISARPSGELLLKFVEDFKSLKSLTLILSLAANRVLSEVNFFKIILADNTVLYIDSQFKTVWQNSDIPSLFSTTINNARSYNKSIFQDNVQSVNLFTAPGYFSFTHTFYEFIYACEDLPQKRMLRVAILNQYKEEVSPPLRLSPQKRFFIVGFWPWQDEGSRLIQQDLRIIKSFFSEELNRDIYYSEIRANLPQYQSFQGVKIRAAFLRDTGLSWPRMGILTNLPDDKPMEGIISQYLLHWPNQDEAYQDFLKKSEKTFHYADTAAPAGQPAKQAVYSISSTRMDLWQNLGFLLKTLNGFCQRYFFPPGYENVDFSTMKQRFYSLPGRLKRQKNRLIISLLSPPGYNFQKELFYAARRVNESGCQAPNGCQIQFRAE